MFFSCYVETASNQKDLYKQTILSQTQQFGGEMVLITQKMQLGSGHKNVDQETSYNLMLVSHHENSRCY